MQTDLIGPVDFKVLTETGRTEYLTDEGMLGSTHAFLDEVFDGRDMLLRSILNVLHERELKHGRQVTKGKCECAVMTSNRYLSEVLARSPETLQAFADRISFICFTPKSFAKKSSRAQMLWRAQTGQRPVLQERLTLQHLDVLQAAVEQVQVPPIVSEGLEALADTLEKELDQQVSKLPDYVPTKYFSQRSVVKALWALKAAVVRDRVYRRSERPLVAELGDLDMLRHFWLLGGPPPTDLDALLKLAADPRERAQLEILRVEHKAFDESLRRILPALNQAALDEARELTSRDDLSLGRVADRDLDARRGPVARRVDSRPPGARAAAPGEPRAAAPRGRPRRHRAGAQAQRRRGGRTRRQGRRRAGRLHPRGVRAGAPGAGARGPPRPPRHRRHRLGQGRPGAAPRCPPRAPSSTTR